MNALNNKAVAAHVWMTTAIFVAFTNADERRNERGVVSIEYLVLGGAIIAIIGLLASQTDIVDSLATGMKNLFSRASGGE